MLKMNKLYNLTNPHQGSRKKVLCVCSAGLLRSPTMAVVLSQPPFHFNTRAVGVSREFALIDVDEYLLEWADCVLCASPEVKTALVERFADVSRYNIISMNIPDNFQYMEHQLVREITQQAKDIFYAETH